MVTRLIVPDLDHFPRYRDALERGWSADSIRGTAATQEELAHIANDAALFLARCTNLRAEGGPLTLPNGQKAQRLPGRVFWIWGATEEAPDDFCGSINIRWQPGVGAALPTHVLGHAGYAVAPWAQRRGHATAALMAVQPWLRNEGLPYFEVSCNADNTASVKVIERAGGVLHGHFNKPAYWGGKASLRFRIPL